MKLLFRLRYGFTYNIHSSRLFNSTLPIFSFLTIIFLTINCGPVPSQRLPIPELHASDNSLNTEKSDSQILPKSALVNQKEISQLKEVFKLPVTSTNNRAGLEDFHVKSSRNANHSAIVSNCNLDILKAFIVQGWAPIVKHEFHGRTSEILPIAEYSDHTQQISLQNVNKNLLRRVSYNEFETSFNRSSRNQCVLISRSQLSEAIIRKVLSKYLPSETYKQISVRSR
ncbi:hypothetical protein JT359_10310 [Candidatus Poribacteria bacterium]|nr:hypothetical protein [Candidatus Poribacteria bacterium]